jgi:hypothetical protein
VSLGGTIIKANSRHSEGTTLSFLGHVGNPGVELPDSNFPVSTSKLRGVSLDQVENPQPDLDSLDGLEGQTNSALREFGIGDGGPRSDLLRSYNGDRNYGSDVIKTAAQVGREIGFLGAYERTSDEARRHFISLARFIHQNDVHAARLILANIGIDHIEVATREIIGYTGILVGSELALVPKKYTMKNIPEEMEGSNALYATLMMQILRYQRQSFQGIPMYVGGTQTQNKH